MKIIDNIMLWLVAARPKTLVASISPVIVGIAMAYSKGVINIPISVLALIVALFAQIASNYANDYFDFIKGIDNDKRRGPARAVAMGWITPKAMLIATIISTGIAAIAGVILVWQTSWWLLLVGALIILGIFAYSTGPYPLSSNGWGDVAVMFFYGIVPVCGTIYLLTGDITLRGFLLSLSMGFVAMNVLVVNNYRDYESDMAVNKRTSIVKYGEGFGVMLYLFCAASALITAVVAICITDSLGEDMVAQTVNYTAMLGLNDGAVVDIFKSNKFWLVIFVIEFGMLQFIAWQKLRKERGEQLNSVLALTARNVFLWAIFLSIILVM